jgi:hypothetical protein
MLATDVKIRKVASGIYTINASATGRPLYELLSRRRRPREEV